MREKKVTHRGNSRHDNRVKHRRLHGVFQVRVLRLLLLRLLLLIVLVVLIAGFTPAQGGNNTPNGALYFPVSLERLSRQRLVYICRPRPARAPDTSSIPNTVEVEALYTPFSAIGGGGAAARPIVVVWPV